MCDASLGDHIKGDTKDVIKGALTLNPKKKFEIYGRKVQRDIDFLTGGTGARLENERLEKEEKRTNRTDARDERNNRKRYARHTILTPEKTSTLLT